MAKVVKIEFNKTPYPVKFGYGAFAILGEKWKCKGINGVMKVFNENFAPPEGTKEEDFEITFEAFGKLADMVEAGLENADKSYSGELDREDILDEIMFNQGKMNAVMESFTSSISGDSGNPKPRKSSGKGKPKV